MSKVVVAYIVAGLGLFGALFAAFALTGLARPVAEEVAVLPAVAEDPVEPAPLPGAFVPPTLEAGRAYRVSHDIPIHDTAGAPVENAEAVEAGGVFTFVRTLDSPPGPWMEITTYDGQRDRTMYLKCIDLRWKVLTPVFTPSEEIAEEREAVQRWIQAQGFTFGRQRRVEEPPPPPEPEPQEFAQWWAGTAESLGGASVANLIVSGVAAGLTTVLTLGAIGVLSLFRRRHSWSSATIYTQGDGSFEENYPSAQVEDESAEYDDVGPRRI